VTLWLAFAACRLPPSGRDEPASTSGELEVDDILVFPQLDIGADPPASQEVRIQNGGSGPLAVMAPRIEGDDAFTVAGDAVVLEPSESHAYAVVFDPQTPFAHEAKLILGSDAAGSTVTEVALHGEAVAPVIDPEASTLAMGEAYLGCSVVKSFAVQNNGNETLEFAPSFRVGSPEIALVNGGHLVQIAPGNAASIQVSYEPVDANEDTAVLVLDSTDPIRPLTEIEVSGVGASVPTQSDWFESAPPSTDVVFVVDNSHSMSEEQTELIDSIGSFVDALAASGVDYRIGVITSDTSKFEDEVVTNGTPDPVTVLADQIAGLGTGGAGTTRSLQMLYDCVQPGSDCSEKEGFLRPDALLDAIVVADDPDESALTPEAYVDYLWTLKSDPALVRIDAVAGAIPIQTCGTCSSPGFGYDEAVELTDGTYLDICGDWDDNLALLGSSAVSPASSRFELSETPDVDTIEVFVDGAPIAPGNWTYVGNAIQFDLAALPPPGAKIEVRYTVAPKCG
jgi:hypothetical protein